MNYGEAARIFSTARYPERGKPYGRNTKILHETKNTYEIQFWSTDIITFYRNGNTKLSGGGWRSVTTQARMNQYSGYNVYSDGGIWRVNGYLFYDGITFNKAGNIVGDHKAKKEKRIHEHRKAGAKQAAETRRDKYLKPIMPTEKLSDDGIIIEYVGDANMAKLVPPQYEDENTPAYKLNNLWWNNRKLYYTTLEWHTNQFVVGSKYKGKIIVSAKTNLIDYQPIFKIISMGDSGWGGEKEIPIDVFLVGRDRAGNLKSWWLSPIPFAYSSMEACIKRAFRDE